MTSDALKRRMGELRIRRSDLAEAAAMPMATLGRLLDGRTKRLRDADAEDRLERALGWVAGSFDSIRHGQGPIPFDERIEWPGEHGTYADAVDAAWARFEQRGHLSAPTQTDLTALPEDQPPATAGGGPQGFDAYEPVLRRHLDDRHVQLTRQWPLWLTERLAQVIDAPESRMSTTAQLAGTVIGVEYLTEVARILDARRTTHPGRRDSTVTDAMRTDLERIRSGSDIETRTPEQSR